MFSKYLNLIYIDNGNPRPSTKADPSLHPAVWGRPAHGDWEWPLRSAKMRTDYVGVSKRAVL